MCPVSKIARLITRRVALTAGIWCALGSLALAYSIQSDQLDRQKVFYGTPEKFEKPAEVDYEEVVRVTPEYQEIKKKKVERGTGRYWILLSQASDHAVRTICKVGEATEHDLIAARGYLGTLDPPIPATDVTDLVVESLHEENKEKTDK